MNQIYCNGLTFDDAGKGKGRLLDGSFFVENSLSEDELSIDTLSFTVRYPLDGTVDTTPTTFPYGTKCLYFQDAMLFGEYYLKKVERISRYEYSFDFQSAIGLLDDSTHYGGIYNGEKADVIISDIIGNTFNFEVKEVFSKIKLYGWLPIATRRENLKQVLFACGGCIKKNSIGNVLISTLDTTTPMDIPDNRVLEGGKISYNTLINRVEVTEHGYIKNDDTPLDELYKGEISGQNFTTPKGFAVKNAAIVTWDKPHHSLTVEGSSILNDEVDVNYAIIKASPNAIVKGKPYLHTEAFIYKDKPNYKGKEKIATVKDATLVSLANSGSTAERVLAYYGNSNTLSTRMILDGEKPTNTISITNPFGDKSVGFIKNIDGGFGQQITAGDIDVVLNYRPPVVVGSRTLVSIAITKSPLQTKYATGDYFNTDGMEVVATYDDGTTDILSAYSYEPTGPLTEMDDKITISYTELGVTATTTQKITVMNMLRRIAVTVPPENIDYYEEDVFDPTGMEVTAYYSDGSGKVLKDGEYSYSPTGPLTKADETITITYTDTGITATAYQDITVGDAPNLVSIEITKNPDKMKYRLGDTFNTKGMEVTAHFDNGTSRMVRGYTYSPDGALGKDDTTITISYVKKGVMKQTTLDITVFYLTSIAITTPPTYTEYYEGNNFNKAGMVVTAYYSDESNSILDENAYSVDPLSLTCKDTFVTISYTEQGVTQTTTQAVTVTYFPYDYTNSKVITQSGTYHLSDIGATHRNIRIVSISGGNGGNGGNDGGNGWGSYGSSIGSGSTGTRQSDPGSGGAGGKGGIAVEGGRFITQELVLDNDAQDIVINVGTGGKGGAVGGTLGEAGGDTSCVIGAEDVNSKDGSTNPQGFTDIFTQKTYCLGGSAGDDGADGGRGSSVNGQGSEGSGIGEMIGGTGGTGASSSKNENKIENPAPTFQKSTGPMKTVIQPGNTRQTVSGGSQVQFSTSGNHNISVYGNKTVGYKKMEHHHYENFTTGKVYDEDLPIYTEGDVYTNLRNDNIPAKANGVYYSSVDKVHCFVSDLPWPYTGATTVRDGRHDGTKSQTTTIKKTYVYKEHARTITVGYGGGGGGGASTANPGGSANYSGQYIGYGGQGGQAKDAIVPDMTSYGSSGGSGSGGGGGGGAGSTYASISGDNSYQGSSANASSRQGGAGGKGSAGADGVQGCVIIYYS